MPVGALEPKHLASRMRLTRTAWAATAFCLLVILWGALVRATGSGAGCGNHWPLCDGQALPVSARAATLIEFTHRVSTGVLSLLVIAVLWWTRRAFEPGHPARRAAAFALGFTLGDALLGAGLVLYHLVERDASAYRAVAMSAHLVNTFLLLGAMTLTAWYSSGRPSMRSRGQGAIAYALGFAALGVIVLGVSGAITALGDTLFPAHSLSDGLSQDVSPTAHFLVRLRLLHPLIAMSVALYVLLTAGLTVHLRPSVETKRFARWLAGLFVAQVVIGALNVFTLAPIWLQLIHLLLADLLWVSLVLVSASALGGTAEAVTDGPGDVAPLPTMDGAVTARATWKEYLALTKPRVISLLLFTTLAAMFIAAGGWPGSRLLAVVALGGYMAAGAANAINMVIDRDIDARMRRTAKRPTVTQRISTRSALLFAVALAAGSFGLLTFGANLLAAMLAFAGLAFYVIVYTVVLKRRTWHNIVIGGAAGAFPPLVGWSAVTGDLNALAWCLFAIIFVWTPVHFWALALLMKDDYQEAGIPMLPCVLGERATVIQIGLYALLTAVVSALPLAMNAVGHIYIVATVLLNISLLARSLALLRSPGRPRALALFKYSMAYLALLFLAMAADRTVRF